jgi:hypothetical protein
MPNTVPVSQRPHQIYALVDPQDPGRYHYIGTSCRPLPERLNKHLVAARHPEKTRHAVDVVAWLQQVLAAGRRPRIVELATAPNQETAEAIEDLYISAFRGIGHPLTNARGGGRGKHSDASRARMRGPRLGRVVVDLDSGVTWPSITAAAAALGCAYSNVTQALAHNWRARGRRLAYAGAAA